MNFKSLAKYRKKVIFWIVLSLLIKCLLYLLFLFPNYENLNTFGPFLKTSDHGEIVRPIDNFFETGIYALDNHKESYYAGRLPGFLFPYGIYRFFLNEHDANLLLGISILLLAALSTYVLGNIVFRFTNNFSYFLIAFILANILPYYWCWDWMLHPFSLSNSALLFGIYFLIQYFDKNKSSAIVLSGALFTWVFMLRGFTYPFIPLTLLFIVFHLYRLHQQINFKKIIYVCSLFLIPFVFAEGGWIIRNFITFNKFIPLQTSFVPGANDDAYSEYSAKSTTKYSVMKIREMIDVWGGDNFWYFENADLAWFFDKNEKIKLENAFPSTIFFEGFSPDSLRILKKDLSDSYTFKGTKEEQEIIENRIIDRSSRFAALFKENKKTYYYFISPLNRFQNFLFKNPAQDWPVKSIDKSGVLLKGFKIISFLHYGIAFFALIIFMITALKRRIAPFHLYLFLLGFSIIINFMFIINSAHYYYFMNAHYLYIALLLLLIYNWREGKTKYLFN